MSSMSIPNHRVENLPEPSGFVLPEVGVAKRLLILTLAVGVGLLANEMPGLVLAAVAFH